MVTELSFPSAATGYNKDYTEFSGIKTYRYNENRTHHCANIQSIFKSVPLFTLILNKCFIWYWKDMPCILQGRTFTNGYLFIPKIVIHFSLTFLGFNCGSFHLSKYSRRRYHTCKFSCPTLQVLHTISKVLTKSNLSVS